MRMKKKKMKSWMVVLVLVAVGVILFSSFYFKFSGQAVTKIGSVRTLPNGMQPPDQEGTDSIQGEGEDDGLGVDKFTKDEETDERFTQKSDNVQGVQLSAQELEQLRIANEKFERSDMMNPSPIGELLGVLPVEKIIYACKNGQSGLNVIHCLRIAAIYKRDNYVAVQSICNAITEDDCSRLYRSIESQARCRNSIQGELGVKEGCLKQLAFYY